MKGVTIVLTPDEIMIIIKAIREQSQIPKDEEKAAVELHDRLNRILAGI